MKKLNLLSKAEMKKVMGGVVDPGEGGGGGSVTCQFKYKYEGSNTWTNWSEPTTYAFGDCNSWCLTFMSQGSVAHCGYDTID